MRILHLVHQYPPDHLAGTELYTQTLARRQAAAGHSVAVFAPVNRETAGGPALEEGVRVWRAAAGERSPRDVFLSTFRQPALAGQFGRALEVERPDIVHVQHLMGLPAATIDELDRRAIRYVISLHDYWFGCANGQLLTNYDGRLCGGPAPDWRNCARCVLARAGMDFGAPLAFAVTPLLRRRHARLRPIFDGARRVIAPASFVREAHARIGFDTGKTVVIGHGTLAAPSGPPALSRAARGPLRLGYLGSLSRQKGVHVLIEAMNGLPPGAATLAVYGDPSVFPDYAAELRAASVHPGITFPGVVARENLWARLAELDALVLPTLWYEASPLVIGEAFAAGLPVIASRIGSLPELIADDRDGLLFPAGDAATLRDLLASLAADPEKLARLQAGVRPPRTIDDHAAAIEAVYDEALGR